MSAFATESSLWAWYLLDVACKSSILILLVVVIDRLLLRRRPLAADAVWSATVLLLGLLPLFCLATPRIFIPWPTAAYAPEPNKPPVATVHNLSAEATSHTVQPSGALPVSNTIVEPNPVAIAAPADTPTVAKPTVAAREWPNLLWLVVAVYLAGVVLAGLRLATAYRAARRLRSNASLITSGPWADALRECKGRVGLAGDVQLYESPDVAAPLTLGWRRPAIVLATSSVEGIDAAGMQVVLLHELTHIARRDFAWNLLAKCVHCLYWLNPLMLIVSRRLAQCREIVCDGICVSSLGSSDKYVHLLLGFAESAIRRRQLTLGLTMVGKTQLEHRLENLTPLGRAMASNACRGGVAAAALVMSVLLSTSTLGQPASDNVDRDSQTSIDEVIEGLRKAEAAIETLAVQSEVEYEFNVTEPGKPLEDERLIEDGAVTMHRIGDAAWEMDKDGKGRAETNYLKTNTRFDGSQRTKREGIVSVFDGEQGGFETTIYSDEGTVLQKWRQQPDVFMKTSSSPFDYSILHNGKAVSDLLAEHEGTVVGEKEWNERSLLVVDVEPVRVRDDYIYKQQFWIDPERSYLPVRRFSYVQRGDEMPWGLHLQVDLSSVKEVSPGIWLPCQIDNWNYHVTDAGQGHLVSREHIVVSEWKVNAALDPDRLTLAPQSVDSIGEPITEKKPAATPDTKERTDAEDSPEGFRPMIVRTVDSDGKPVAGTNIFVNVWPAGKFKTLKQDYTTGEDGSVSVLVPDPPRLFRVWTKKQGYVPLFAQWWPEHQADGDQIPDEFTFKLPTGTQVGGTIQNDKGEPIEGVTVEVMLANQVDEMGRRPVPSIWLAEVPGPGNNPCTTNAEGKWSIDNVPEGDDIRVRLKLTHPDYISDYQWGELQSEQGVGMESLRDKSAVLVMQRGVTVTGTVRDAQQNPVSNAVVIWGDDPYLQTGSQEVHTDNDGVYRFAPLPPGPVRLTVVAPGWAPQTRLVDVNSEGGPEDFDLTKGQVLRIEFVDHSGKPVPNAYVRIDRWRNSQSLYNHRHPNVLNTHIPIRANDEGIFEWDWAPADAVEYVFSAGGHRSKDQSVTADGTTQTIVLD
ncbi:M56 family metallopeptidase [Aeoliella sp.]|uniref:M56 family metallopeptidase n=1 Tax=Aeoliella sp. TaxID=2795800 RepID=UPI003CCBA3E4